MCTSGRLGCVLWPHCSGSGWLVRATFVVVDGLLLRSLLLDRGEYIGCRLLCRLALHAALCFAAAVQHCRLLLLIRESINLSLQPLQPTSHVHCRLQHWRHWTHVTR